MPPAHHPPFAAARLSEQRLRGATEINALANYQETSTLIVGTALGKPAIGNKVSSHNSIPSILLIRISSDQFAWRKSAQRTPVGRSCRGLRPLPRSRPYSGSRSVLAP